MPYLADTIKARGMIGRLVGNGQCVTFVHAVVEMPATPDWTIGVKVKGSMTLKSGTVIAVFDPNGRYGNHMDGRSHAAIYLGQDAKGIQVLDQWKGRTAQPVHQRTIQFKNGHGVKVNDGDQYNVVE